MPYVLIAAAAAIFMIRLTKLRQSGSPETFGMPWGPLLVWAILLVGGASVWMVAAHIR